MVAEGVENEALLQRLRGMGCDEAQGNHIDRPMPADKANKWIGSSSWAKNSALVAASQRT